MNQNRIGIFTQMHLFIYIAIRIYTYMYTYIYIYIYMYTYCELGVGDLSAQGCEPVGYI